MMAALRLYNARETPGIRAWTFYHQNSVRT